MTFFASAAFFLTFFGGRFLQPVFHNAPFTDKMWAGGSNPEIWAPAAPNVQTRAAPERSRPNSDDSDDSDNSDDSDDYLKDYVF